MIIVRWLCTLGALLTILAWAAPLLAAVVDMGGWFFGLGGLSGVTWNGARAVFALLWTFGSPIFLVPLAAALGELASDA